MRRNILCLILLSIIFSCTSSYAQSTPEDEIKQLEGVIQLLEDEKQTEQLKALLRAKKELLEQQAGTEALEPEAGINFVLVFSKYTAQFSAKLKEFGEKLAAVVTDYRKLADYFSDKENFNRLLDIGLKLLLAGGAGFILLLLLKKSRKRWAAKLDIEEVAGFAQKFKIFWLRFFLGVYPLLILTAAVVVFLWLVLPGEAAILTRILAALVSYRIALSAISHLFSPEDAARRLISLSDKTAIYIYIWGRRLLLFSLWAYLAITLSAFYNLREIAFILFALYKIGMVVMVALILAQWKEAIAGKLSIEVPDTDSSTLQVIKRSFNSMAGHLYLFFLGYFSVIVVFSLLGFERLWRYFLYSTLKSLVAVIVIAGLWRLWDLAFGRLFEVSANIRQRLPGLEDQVNRYVSLIGKLGHVCILVVGLLAVLNMWQVDVSGFLVQYSNYLFRIIRIPVILGIAMVCVQAGDFMLKKFEWKIVDSRKKKEDIPDVEIEKQVTTITSVLRKAISVAIWVVATLMVIRELGFDIGPALAGAGIFGIALGFGTQNLVRDIISGLFMIAENQIRVGDVAILNGTGGLVEAINLRTTVLRGLDGTVHVFPNGAINTLSNMTREFSFYLFDIGVAYKEDTDRVIEVLKKLGDEIMQDEDFAPAILEPLEILGVDKFADSAVIIKARIKTLPIKQWMVGREMNRRIKKRFDEEGIEIPFPHRTFYFGDVSPAVKVKNE